jgi:serine/threonine protein kinase/tetratricopeptide (TPR) repeat protein
MIERSEASFGERFEVVRLLGQGGQGIVHEVFDRATQRRLALKTLRDWDAASSARFKREFRALSEVQHPCLIRLHELFEADGRLFFTMDLVDGRHFLAFVRDADSASPEVTDTVTAESGLRHAFGGTRHELPAAKPFSDWRFDELRLRQALSQLIDALEVLHESGLVHRDIKPSNILVRENGALCLLDFGLVSDKHAHESSTLHVVGTAVYMAPEQSAYSGVGPAADWYAVGVVLFHALTGRLPFDGPPIDVLVNKRTLDAPSPSSLVSGLPDDLVSLCEQLLLRDANERVAGAPWRRLRHSEPPAPLISRRRPSRSHVTAFFGRARELAWLGERYARMVDTGAVTVSIAGESGIGKSALLSRFMEQIAERHERTVVLSGRCYERESIHYKGVDGLVDSLVRFLRGLRPEECAWFIPRHVPELIRQFPAFEAVHGFSNAARQLPSSDANIARSRAAAALRELLVRLGDRFPAVVIIDDAQWIDSDGSSLLQDLLRPPDAPRLLLICSYTLRAGVQSARPVLGADDVLEVGPLLDADTAALAREHSGRLGLELPQGEASALAAEANGHPILLYELVRHASGLGDNAPRSGLRLDDVLRERVQALPEDARLVLELACTCEVPLRRELVVNAAGLELGRVEDCTELLVADRLLTASSGSVQPSHDRVRKAVVGAIGAEALGELHRRLAVAFEALLPEQVESLATHWSRAQDPVHAAPHAAAAGRAAAAAFAFDRACSFYKLALLGTEERSARLTLSIALGGVLASAGRSLDAASAFLDAARLSASEHEALELRRRAAEELLRSGHIDEGIEVLQSVLAPLGIALRTAPRHALASLLYHRARLALRGMNHELTTAERVPPDILQRIDACWSIASGLGLVDMIQGADFQTRGLLLALRAGEPERLVQGPALEAALLASEGSAAQPRVSQLLEKASGLLHRVENPESRAWLLLARGIVALQNGRFAECLGFCSEAETILLEECVGTSWQLARAQIFCAWSLVYLGRLREVRVRVPRLLDEYGKRQDVFSQMTLKLGPLHVLGMADDAVAEMRKECQALLTRWSQKGFHFQHLAALFTLVAADLYEGRAAEAFERMEASWPKLEASLLLRAQFIRIDVWFLRGRAALLLAVAEPKRRRALSRVVQQAVQHIEREGMPWSNGMASSLGAGLSGLAGDSANALRRLQRAEAAFAAAGMRLYAACCALQAGQISGAQPVRDGVFDAEGVRRPELYARVLIPVPGVNPRETSPG